MKNPLRRTVSSKRRGATLVEMMTAAVFTVLVLAGAFAALLSGSSAWIRGGGSMNAEATAQRSVRKVAHELRQAMVVTVDGDGRGLTYRMPMVDGSGSYTVPPVWDGVTRRIELVGTNLDIVENASRRRLASGVTQTDPLGNQNYRIFTAGAGAVTRQITVQLAVQKNTVKNYVASSRSREVIFLRNIPELIR